MKTANISTVCQLDRHLLYSYYYYLSWNKRFNWTAINCWKHVKKKCKLIARYQCKRLDVDSVSWKKTLNWWNQVFQMPGEWKCEFEPETGIPVLSGPQHSLWPLSEDEVSRDDSYRVLILFVIFYLITIYYTLNNLLFSNTEQTYHLCYLLSFF